MRRTILGPMLLDSHTHVFPAEVRAARTRWMVWEPYFGALYGTPKAALATAQDLLAAMDRDGVDRSVACNFGWVRPATVTWTNDVLLDAAAASGGRLIPLISLVPGDTAASLHVLEQGLARGAAGLGELMPDSWQGSLLDDWLAPVLAACEEARAVVLVHCSEPVGHRYPGKGTVWPHQVLEAVMRHPGIRWILAHLGGGLPFYAAMPEVREALRASAWADTSATPFLYTADGLRAAAQLLGEDRILFGTDFPLLGVGRTRALLEEAGLATPAILGGNLARLLDG